MNRTCALVFPLFALLFAASAPAALPANRCAPQATTAIGGAYFITFNVSLASPLPAGAAVLCKARIEPGPAPFQSFSPGIAPVRAAQSLATVAGNTANCSVQIPFYWSVGALGSGIDLSYEIQAVGAFGLSPASRSSRIRVAYPPAGATASLAIPVRF